MARLILPQDLEVTVMMDVCSHELRNLINMSSSDSEYRSGREDIPELGRARERETAMTQFKSMAWPMEVDEVRNAFSRPPVLLLVL